MRKGKRRKRDNAFSIQGIHAHVYDQVCANGENEKLRKEETNRCLSVPYYGT